MRHCFYALLLLAPTVSIGGEWTHSPTVELGYYQTDISSPNPDLIRHGAVWGALFSLTSDYESAVWRSNLSYQIESLRYQQHPESDTNIKEIRLINEWRPYEDVISMTHRWGRYNETFDAVQGGFVDELFSTPSESMRYKESLTLAINSPTHWGIETDVDVTVNEDAFEPLDNDVKQELPEQSNVVINYRAEEKREGTPFYWRFSGVRYDQTRDDGQQFINDQNSGVLWFPLVGPFNLTAKAEWSRYVNNNDWEHGGSNRTAETLSRGLGFSWSSRGQRDFLQLTLDNVHDDDAGESWSWAADTRWRFADRIFFSANKTYRFYGDAYRGDLEYQGLNHRFSVSYNENVRQRYVAVPEIQYNGVYICEPGDEAIVDFDPAYCFLPEDGDVQLEPGQILLPDTTRRFPLEPRLRLVKYGTAKWIYTGKEWDHEIWVRQESDQDLTNDAGNDEREAWFNGEYSLNGQSFLRARFRYRHLLMRPSYYETTDRLFSLGYHHELNTKASWSISFQHMNKRTTGDDYTYDDNRIVLKYEHFLGKKHTKKRSFF